MSEFGPWEWEEVEPHHGSFKRRWAAKRHAGVSGAFTLSEIGPEVLLNDDGRKRAQGYLAFVLFEAKPFLAKVYHTPVETLDEAKRLAERMFEQLPKRLEEWNAQRLE